MKRIVILTLSMLLVLSLVACGNNSNSASSTAESSIIETPSEETSSEGTSSDYVSSESSEMNDSSEELNDETSKDGVSSEDTSDDISEETSEVSEPSDESLDESSESISENESSEPEECAHKKTVVKNKKAATCAEKGYTGDLFCIDCQTIIVEGETIDKSVIHGETELVGCKEATSDANGYTGDWVCMICGKIVVKGEVTSMPQAGSTFIDEFGNSVFVPAGENVFDYTLNKAKDKIPNVDHPYISIDLESRWEPGEFEHGEWDTLTIEKEVFKLVNEERVKAGVAPLEWCEEAYYFAYTRAREQEESWGHTRPNGKDFNHIFSEYNVFPGYCGENLYLVTTFPNGGEKRAVESWVESSGHYKNMINSKYTRTAIAVYFSETTGCSYFVQLFFR